MANANDGHPAQHIGGTVLVVMMDVEPEHEEEFNRWYDDEHLPERLEIPGYVSESFSTSRRSSPSTPATTARSRWVWKPNG